MNPDELSPKAALEALYRLRALIEELKAPLGLGGGVRTRICSSRSCCSLTSEGASVI